MTRLGPLLASEPGEKKRSAATVLIFGVHTRKGYIFPNQKAPKFYLVF